MYNPIKANPDNFHGIKIQIYPNEEQKQKIKRISGLYRYVFNKCLEIEILNYLHMSKEQFDDYRSMDFSIKDIFDTVPKEDRGKFIQFQDMCKILSGIRNSTPWMKDIPINTARYALRNVCNAFRCFFDSFKQKRVKGRIDYPRFKKKRDNKETFSCRGERVRFKGNMVRIEGIGWIDIKSAKVPSYYPYYGATVSYDGYENYYLSLQTEIINPIKLYPNEGPIGIDVGLRKLVTLSDGTMYKALNTKRLELRRRKMQSKVTKDRDRRYKECIKARTKLDDVPMSKRAERRYKKYRNLTTHIWNKRRTYIHQITREIVNRRPSAIVIEDLNINYMQSEFHSNIDMKEYMFGQIRKQIEYKSRWVGIPVIIADRYYPSSQLCSRCGHRQKIGKTEIYKCSRCGLEIDRDINAALNLRSLAI